LSARRSRLFAGVIAVLGFSLPVAADSLAFRASLLPLEGSDGGVAKAAGFEFRGAIEIASADPDFGGFSDMVATPDGLLVVSDLGFWWSIALRRDPAGRLLGIGELAKARIRDEKGDPLDGKVAGDAEALTRLADGSLLVGFEQHHRLRRFAAGDGGPPQGAGLPFDQPKEMASLPGNSGIESMALLADGRLLLCAEGKTDTDADFSAWLGTPGAWHPLTLMRRGSFRPTALARLADGDLLLLERTYRFPAGFVARLSRVRAASLVGGARIEPETLIQLRWPYPIDNFEALATVASPAGGTDIYLLSDDNRNPLQRTILLAFHAAAL